MSEKLTRPQRDTRKQEGFSLIELLIVVAVILIISAIAIPNFLRSRMRANETAAVQNLRTITTANIAYLTTYGIGYVTDLPKLGGNLVNVDKDNAGLIEPVLAQGRKQGYSFIYSVATSDAQGNPTSFTINAEPLNPGATGDRYFFTNQTGVIRQSITGAATVADTPI